MTRSKATTKQAEEQPGLTLGDIQNRYAIVFTEAEVKLLTTSNGLLHSAEQQQAFILKSKLTGIQCPACLGLTCRLACEVEGSDKTAGENLCCNRCGAWLQWHLGFVMGWEWFSLIPGQTFTVPGEPPAPRPRWRAAERVPAEDGASCPG